jgi:hypothetical protein
MKNKGRQNIIECEKRRLTERWVSLYWQIKKFLDIEMGICYTQVVENLWLRHPVVKLKIDG